MPTFRVRRLHAVAAAMMLLVAGCVAGDDHETETAGAARERAKSQSGEVNVVSENGGADGGDEGTEGDPAVASAIEELEIRDVEFVEGSCGLEVSPELAPRCGTVSVPVDWSNDEGTIDLAVAVFPSTAEDPAPDPIVYLEGGPGGHSLDTIRFVESSLVEPLLARGDVIFFDQRGAGRSEPRLSCPEVEAVEHELADVASMEQDEADALSNEALAECSARLTAEGIDLGAFTTINNAHDVEAIRVALGYEQWNLHGVSYGTRLALEVMRQHHGGVRSVVIDSVLPAQVDPVLENPATFVASYDNVVSACSAEPACAADGDLGERLAAVVAQYEADPARVTVENFLTGETDQLYLDGDAIVGIVTQALYTPVWFTDLPEMVAGLEAGDTEPAESFLDQQRTNEMFFSVGMFYAIVCNEEASFADPEAVRAALPPDPFGLDDSFNFASNNGTNAFGTCDAFGSTPADPLSNEAVVSDIPTLVMAGRFDPVTPVAWAEAAASTLPNSHLVVHPNESHGVSSDLCGLSIMTAFLDAPEVSPDTSCFDDGGFRFVGPPVAAVTMEPSTLPTADGREIVTVRPQGWIHGTLPGDSYRQASFLDGTQLIQVESAPELSFGLEGYLGERLGVTLGQSEAVMVGGQEWRRRTGSNAETIVEWYEGEVGGIDVIVFLVSTAEELEANIETVLTPVLETIDVR